MTEVGTVPEDVPLSSRVNTMWDEDYPYPWDASFAAFRVWNDPDDDLPNAEWYRDGDDVVIFAPGDPDQWLSAARWTAVDVTEYV